MKPVFILLRLLAAGLRAALVAPGLISGRAARAPAPAWQSALAIGAPSLVVAGTATDASGNLYVMGRLWVP